MKEIPTKKGDMLEIYEANGKYILKYPTFNITMPEVVKEIPKEAVDSYLAGEHDGEELINYANFGFWKSKISQEDANIQFLRDNPEFLLIETYRKRHYFSEKEFEELLKKAISLELKPTELDAIGIVDSHLELLLVDPVGWEEEIEVVHLEILQEKMNNYIHFLESKQYVARYGDKFDKKVIHIKLQYSPSDNGLTFLEAVQKVLQPTDMSLKVELSE